MGLFSNAFTRPSLYRLCVILKQLFYRPYGRVDSANDYKMPEIVEGKNPNFP